MDIKTLISAFRTDVCDDVQPYLWSDKEIIRYINDAYLMFVRLTGGIPDTYSEAAEVAITAGNSTVSVNSSVLRIMNAYRGSDGKEVTVINPTDLYLLNKDDYGRRYTLSSTAEGEVEYLVIGEGQHTGRVINTPIEDDTLKLYVYRLPLNRVESTSDNLDEVDEMHHLHLIDWMKHLAYKKQDSETLNPDGSMMAYEDFSKYCRLVRLEWERAKHKTRVVQYGGL
jgi:hypothetical protein